MAATFQQVWFICMFLSLNCLFITFDYFSVGHSVFYWFLERPFYIIETNPLFVNWTANIFSQYALWPLVLFKVFITMQKVDFYVVEFINLFFLLQLLAFVSCLEMFPLHWKKIFLIFTCFPLVCICFHFSCLNFESFAFHFGVIYKLDIKLSPLFLGARKTALWVPFFYTLGTSKFSMG